LDDDRADDFNSVVDSDDDSVFSDIVVSDSS